MKWMEKIKTGRGQQIFILLLVGVLLFVIALPTDSPSAGNVQTETEPAETGTLGQSTEEQLEARLREILGQVEGIGKTEVMITLKSDGREIVEKDRERQEGMEVPQENETASGSSQINSSESTVYQKDSRGNEIPYVTQRLSPEISGVLVIAQGGGNAVVVNEITEAVMALFGVEAHKIKVMKME